jgi:glutaredoxin
MLKKYFDENSISYIEKNVQENDIFMKEIEVGTGAMTVPQVHYKGNWIVGFDKKKVDNIIGMIKENELIKIDVKNFSIKTDEDLKQFQPHRDKKITFKIDEDFINRYSELQPNWGPLGEFVYLRTYSRKIESENRNERWFETVKRVVEGTIKIQKEHCSKIKLPWNEKKAQKSAQKMYDKIFNFKFLPPGRGLWMMGTSFVEEKGSAALNNCAFVTTDDIEIRGSLAFTWTMDALMLGVGVGFDANGSGKIKIKKPNYVKETEIFTIPDSREGWVKSLEILLDSFIHGWKLPKFDYSIIRPAGAIIKGFGGTASGPDPLMRLHENIEKLLEKRIGDFVKSTDIVDVMNMIGVCVVAGNVRRSAELALGNWNDKEFITMKDYNKFPEEVKTHRWASNNSINAEVGKTDYNSIADSIILNGEPGIVWLENMRKFGRLKDGENWKDNKVVGCNPCSEQSLESMELCCLVETFPSLHENYEEYRETLKYAYMYAKTVTLLPTHWEETNAVMMRNRRIGASQSGIIDAFGRHGRREMLDWSNNGYNRLQELDTKYSDWLCIPKSIKTTSIKPSGSVALLPGVSAGIHYPHSEYYIRRVRVATNHPLVNIMKNAGYKVDYSAYGNSEEDRMNTSVISFPVHEKFFTKKKTDVSIWEQVKNCIDYQNYWADNQVSITVTFKKEEAKDIAPILYAFEDQLKSISFLPLTEHGYEQAPYEEITKKKFNEMNDNITIPDYTELFSSPDGSKFCDGESCAI